MAARYPGLLASEIFAGFPLRSDVGHFFRKTFMVGCAPVSEKESMTEFALRVHQRFPRWYPVLLALFVVFGYVGYLLQLVLLIALGTMLVFVLITAKTFIAFPVFLAVLLVAWSYLRSLWVKLELPPGRQLMEGEAMELRAEVAAIQRKLHGPRIHRIVVTRDFNAMLTQTPRLGILGWQINTLTVGFTYAMCLSPEEFTAVLAHEFGHASGNHGRFNGWLYRVRTSWSAVLEEMKYHAEESVSAYRKLFSEAAYSVAGAFFRWYVARLDAAMFVLSRQQEIEADRCSAQLTDRSTAARALANVAVRSEHLSSSHWVRVWNGVTTESKPPAGAYRGILDAMRSSSSRDAAEACLTAALAQRTDPYDTHPCLRERLAAITGEENLTAAALIDRFGAASGLQVSAAEQFFGADFERFANEMDQQWQAEVGDDWREQRHRALVTIERKEELENRETLTLEELTELAGLTAQFDPEKAITIFESILSYEPNHYYARLNLGLLKLSSDPALAVTLIEDAMKADSEQIPAGCEALVAHFSRLGDKAKEDEYRARFAAYSAECEAARAERQDFTIEDGMEPHDLTEEQLSEFVKGLATFPTLARAYVAKKRVKYLPRYPYYVYVMVAKVRWYKFYDSHDELLDVALYCPAHGRVKVAAVKNAWIAREIEKVSGSLVYDASQNSQGKQVAASAAH